MDIYDRRILDIVLQISFTLYYRAAFQSDYHLYMYIYTCILKFVVSGYLLVEVIMCGISLDIM